MIVNNQKITIKITIKIMNKIKIKTKLIMKIKNKRILITTLNFKNNKLFIL